MNNKGGTLFALAGFLAAVSLAAPADAQTPGPPKDRVASGAVAAFVARNSGTDGVVETGPGRVLAVFALGAKNTTMPHELGSRYALAASLATPVTGVTLSTGEPLVQGYPQGCAGSADPGVLVPDALQPENIGISNSRWRQNRVISSRGEFFDPTDPDGEGPLKGSLAPDDTRENVVERGTCGSENSSCDAYATFIVPVFTSSAMDQPGLPGVMGRSWFVLHGKPWFGPIYAGQPMTDQHGNTVMNNQEPLLDLDANNHITLEFDFDGMGGPDAELWLNQDERMWAGAWISDNRAGPDFASGELQGLIHEASTQKRGEIYLFANNQRIVGGTGLFANAAGEVLSVGSFRDEDGFAQNGQPKGDPPRWNYYDSMVYARLPCANPGIVGATCSGVPKRAATDETEMASAEQVACNDGIDNDGDGNADIADRECFTKWDHTEAR